MGICSDTRVTSKICGIYLSGVIHVVTFIWIEPSPPSDNLQWYLQLFASKCTSLCPSSAGSWPGPAGCCSPHPCQRENSLLNPECTNTEPRNQSSLWNNFLRISQRGSGRPRIPAYSLNPRLLWQHFTRSLFIYLFFQWANWGMECPAGLFLLLGQALVPQLALGCSAGLGLAQPLSLSPSE